MTIQNQAARDAVVDTRGRAGDPPSIRVTPGQGHSLAIYVRGHPMVTDRRADPGEIERGPEPIEVFVAGLTACVATFAAAFLRRHNLGTAGLAVTGGFSLGDQPTRLTSITLRITPPPHLPPELAAPLLAMARHCTAHNSFQKPPTIDIDWAPLSQGDA